MRDVLITIKGTQGQSASECETIEFVTQGSYCHQKEEAVFSYMESEMTGLQGTKTTFRIGQEAITLTREGTLHAQMVFERGKKHTFLYETPYGATAMGVSTRHVHHGLDAEGGAVEIDYSIDVDSVIISENRFRIQVTPQKGKA